MVAKPVADGKTTVKNSRRPQRKRRKTQHVPLKSSRRCNIQEEDNVKRALIKCATGLSASETVEEFAVEDGELKLVKKKVTKREIPPDIKAVKLLLEGREEPSDEQLESEKQKLLEMLKEF